jgi:hypothetical protein
VGRAVHVLCAATAFLAAFVFGASVSQAAGGCRPGGKSFETNSLEGLTIIHGSARVQSRVRKEGCRALRLGPGRSAVGREVPGAIVLDIAFAYRSARPASRPLLTLPANNIRLVDDGRGHVVLYRGSRHVVRVARRSGRSGWARVHAKLANGALVVRVDRRTARAVAGLSAEQRFVLGGKAPKRAGSLFLDALSVAAPVANGPQAVAGSVSPPAGPSADALGLASRPFAPTSFWNAPLPANAPLDPGSGALVSELRRQLTLGAPWINTTSYSTPVYRVPATQPTVRVALDVPYAPLQQAWQAVPIPANARPSGGTDGAMVVWQPATDTMWEFWRARRTGGAWHARWGGRMTQVSQSPGYYAGAQRNWGATATSLPLLGGLITLDDVRRGRIDHVLAIAVPEARKNWWTWPAQRTDGKKDSPRAIPEGARFRLDPALNIDALGLYPLVRMMAEAAQRYGIVVTNQSGVVTFVGEDPTPTGSNPWVGPAGWFSGQYPSALAQQFPWSWLQALRTNQQCCRSS